MNFPKVLLTGVLVLVIACGDNSKEQTVPVVSFQDAVARPELRGTYLMQVAERVGTPPYVIVSYDDTVEELRLLQETYGFQMQSGIPMAANWKLPRLGDLGKQRVLVHISVFPGAFQPPLLEKEDFLSSLLHELEHAATLQTGRIGMLSILPTFLIREGTFNEDLALSVMELEALRNEIARKEVSEGYFQSRVNLYVEHYVELWEYDRNMEGRTIEDLKVEFFRQGMLTFPAFSREYQARGEVWYFRHPSGKLYFLLPDEIRRIKEKHRISQGFSSPAFLLAVSP